MNTYNTSIIRNEQIADETYQMVLSCPDTLLSAFVPGQFIHMEIPKAEQLTLRRPISVHSVSNSTLTIIYKVVGTGTALLSECQTHECINILGPIGNGFPKPEEQRVLLVGGGLGCAPLLAVPQEYPTSTYTAFLGFATADAAYMTQEMEAACDRCYVTTDDGSLGLLGNAVQAVEKYLDGHGADVIYACGPVPMMRALRQVAAAQKIPCYLSLEERMGCGYGACLTCVCKTKEQDGEHHRRVCVDGPVFLSSEVVFS